MKKLLVNQNGLTLIELLLALAISSMVIVLGASFLITMFKASDRTLSETNLRNEAVLVLDAINKAMENVDDFEVQNISDTGLREITVVEIDKTVNASNTGNEDEVRFSFQLKFKNDDLFIKNSRINDNNYSLNNSYFYVTEKPKQLICKIIIQEKKFNSKPYEIIKIFNLAE